LHEIILDCQSFNIDRFLELLDVVFTYRFFKTVRLYADLTVVSSCSAVGPKISLHRSRVAETRMSSLVLVVGAVDGPSCKNLAALRASVLKPNLVVIILLRYNIVLGLGRSKLSL